MAHTVEQASDLERVLEAVAAVTERLERAEAVAARRQVLLEALVSIHAVLPLRAPLPAFEGDRIAADCGKVLLNAVFEKRPRVVVEFGSGLSTLLFGYALEKIAAIDGVEPGRVISFDHEAAYAEATRANLRRHGLTGVVEVVAAPLSVVDERRVGRTLPPAMRAEAHRFYDLATVSRTLEERLGAPARTGRGSVDLVFVDGPAGGVREPWSRWPALAAVDARLSSGAIVILDDANRPGEAAVLAAWSREFAGMRAEPTIRTLKGTGVLRRGG